MTFVVEKNMLQEAVNLTARAASQKSPIAALEGILLNAHDNIIELTGYDLKTGIYTTVDAEVITQPGSVVVPAKLLSNIVNSLPDGSVKFTMKENYKIKITCEKSKFDLVGINSEDYPELPPITDGKIIDIPQDVLSEMIRGTLFATSTNEARPIYTGELFHVENGELTIVACDGYRLAIRQTPVEGLADIEEFVVPKDALSELEKLCSANKIEKATASVEVSSKYIRFKVNNTTLISRRLEGSFLDYKTTLPKNLDINIIADNKVLKDVLDRVSLIIDEKLKTPVVLTFEENTINFKCQSAIGRAEDTCSAAGDGKGLEIGFNATYLRDAIRASMESEEIEINLSNARELDNIMPRSKTEYQTVSSKEFLQETLCTLNKMESAVQKTLDTPHKAFSESCREEGLNWKLVRVVFLTQGFQKAVVSDKITLLKQPDEFDLAGYERLYCDIFNINDRFYGIDDSAAVEWVVEENLCDGSRPDTVLTLEHTISVLYSDSARNGKVINEQYAYYFNSVTDNKQTYGENRLLWAKLNSFAGSTVITSKRAITKEELFEIFYSYITEYESETTFKEFAELLCNLYDIETNDYADSVCMAISDGLLSIYDIKMSGIDLRNAYLSKIPNNIIIETLIQLGGYLNNDFNKYCSYEKLYDNCLEVAAERGIDITSIDPNGYSDLETVQEWINILLVNDDGTARTHRDLNKFFTADSLVSHSPILLSCYIDTALSAFDILPDCIFQDIAQNGKLTITDDPAKYSTTRFDYSLGGICVYTEPISICIRAGQPVFTYLHEIGHYVSAKLSNTFAVGNTFTNAMINAYVAEGEDFGENVREYGNSSFKEYFADMFAYALLANKFEMSEYESNYPLACDLVMQSLDECRW